MAIASEPPITTVETARPRFPGAASAIAVDCAVEVNIPAPIDSRVRARNSSTNPGSSPKMIAEQPNTNSADATTVRRSTPLKMVERIGVPMP